MKTPWGEAPGWTLWAVLLVGGFLLSCQWLCPTDPEPEPPPVEQWIWTEPVSGYVVGKEFTLTFKVWGRHNGHWEIFAVAGEDSARREWKERYTFRIPAEGFPHLESPPYDTTVVEVKYSVFVPGWTRVLVDNGYAVGTRNWQTTQFEVFFGELIK